MSSISHRLHSRDVPGEAPTALYSLSARTTNTSTCASNCQISVVNAVRERPFSEHAMAFPSKRKLGPASPTSPKRMRSASPNAVNQISAEVILGGKRVDVFKEAVEAIQQGGLDNLKTLESLLEEKPSIVKNVRDGKSLLHYAAEARNIFAIKLLLDYKASAVKKSKERSTFLHILAEMANLQLSEGERNLLKRIIRINRNVFYEKNLCFEVCLHVAAKTGNHCLAKVLQEVDKDNLAVKAKDANAKTPVELAIENRHFNIASIFAQDALSQADSSSFFKCLTAVALEDLSPSELAGFTALWTNFLCLCKQENSGSNWIHFAAMNGNDALIRFVISLNRQLQGPPIGLNVRDKASNTPLHLAAKNGHTSTMALLIEQGANSRAFNAKFETCFHLIAENPLSEMDLKHLRKCFEEDPTNYYQPRCNKSTPLHVAAECGNNGYISLAETLGFSLGKRQELFALTSVNGRTPLHHAAEHGHVSTILLLIRLGAVPLKETADNELWTHSLAYCDSFNASPKEVEGLQDLIVEYPVLLQCQDHEGRTPIYVAAQLGNDDVIMLLAAFAEDDQSCESCVNACTIEGEAPIHVAIQQGNFLSFALLVKSGCDLTLETSKKKTWLHLLAESAHFQKCSNDFNEMTDALIRTLPCLEDVDVTGCNPIHLAAARGHSRFFELIKKSTTGSSNNIGGYIDSKPHDQGSSFRVAALNMEYALNRSQYLATIDLLIDLKAMPTEPDSEGLTMMDYFVQLEDFPSNEAESEWLKRLTDRFPSLLCKDPNVSVVPPNKCALLLSALAGYNFQMVDFLEAQGMESNDACSMLLGNLEGQTPIVRQEVLKCNSIDQLHLQKAIKTHLLKRSTRAELSSFGFEKPGQCQGHTYLMGIYFGRGNGEEFYLSQERLSGFVSCEVNPSSYYARLNRWYDSDTAFLNAWIADILTFQSIYSFGQDNLQMDLIKTYSIVKKDNVKEPVKVSERLIASEQDLIADLKTGSDHFIELKIFFCDNAHVVGLYIAANGLLTFYDANLRGRVPSGTSIEAFGAAIFQYLDVRYSFKKMNSIHYEFR